MSKRPMVKVLVGYHKPSPLFKSDMLIPIHGGRVCAQEATKDGKLSESEFRWLVNNTIGDDTGDNLSKYNRYINEMSPIYWAWKNYEKLGNPEYIGFMQYAKHLIINPNMEISHREWLPKGEMYGYDFDTYRAACNLTQEHMERVLADADILCAMKYNVFNCDGSSTCRQRLDNLANGRGAEVFDVMKKSILCRWPDKAKYLEELEQNSIHYPLNIFVIKKELFFQYCEFIFDILLDILETVDFSDATVVQKRAPAFASEFLTSIFISSCEKKYRVKPLKTAVLSDSFKEIKSGVDLMGKWFLFKHLKTQKRRYKWLSYITWGKKKKYYKEKYRQTKVKLCDISKAFR